MLQSNFQIQEEDDLKGEAEGSRPSRSMINCRQYLAETLKGMGLEIQLSPPQSGEDSDLVVQQEIEQLTSLLVEKTHEIIEDHLTLTELVDHNQNLILKYYARVLSMSETMVIFSKDLYAEGEHISTFQNFKKLYEQFAEYSVLLNSYQPYSQEFEQTALKFRHKQEVLLNKIIFKDDETEPQSSRQNVETELERLRQQNQELKDVLRKYEDELSKYQPYGGQSQGQIHQQNLRLAAELGKLQRILNENNEDFSIQIQRYNRLLYDSREEFKRIQMDLQNEIRILQYSIRQVEKQLVQCKESKYKDQFLIENLIRRNRYREKRDRFQCHSPPRGLNQTTIAPTSPKRVGFPVYRKNI